MSVKETPGYKIHLISNNSQSKISVNRCSSTSVCIENKATKFFLTSFGPTSLLPLLQLAPSGMALSSDF